MSSRRHTAAASPPRRSQQRVHPAPTPSPPPSPTLLAPTPLHNPQDRRLVGLHRQGLLGSVWRRRSPVERDSCGHARRRGGGAGEEVARRALCVCVHVARQVGVGWVGLVWFAWVWVGALRSAGWLGSGSKPLMCTVQTKASLTPPPNRDGSNQALPHNDGIGAGARSTHTVCTHRGQWMGGVGCDWLCLVLSCLVLSWLGLACLGLACLGLSWLVLSWLGLAHPFQQRPPTSLLPLPPKTHRIAVYTPICRHPHRPAQHPASSRGRLRRAAAAQHLPPLQKAYAPRAAARWGHRCVQRGVGRSALGAISLYLRFDCV